MSSNAAIASCFVAAMVLFSSPSTAQKLQPARSTLPAPVALGGSLKDSPVWSGWQSRFLDPTGRVIDDGNGGISHSEGQGYAMLLAVAAGDRRAFDRIWSWTHANLGVRQDRLAVWKWAGPYSQSFDRNNATDGDILISWALAEASDYWNEAAYLNSSRAIASDITEKLVRDTPNHGPVLMPAARGFSEFDRGNGPVVNLSYWVFPAFSRLAKVLPNFDWAGLSENGLALIDQAQFGPLRLPPDWLAVGERRVALADGFDKGFGYNAIRIPLYLFWADAATPARSSAFSQAWSRESLAPLLNDLESDRPGSTTALTEPGYRALAAVAQCASSNAGFPADFYRFTADQHYYPATLHALALVAAMARHSGCLDQTALRENIAPNWSAQTELAGQRPFVARLAARYEPVKAQIVPHFFSDNSGGLSVTPRAEEPPVEHSPDYWPFVGAGGLLLALLVWIGRRLGSAVKGAGSDPSYAFDAPSGGDGAWDPSRPLIVPRKLPFNPFQRSMSQSAYASQIEVAAEACVRHSATIGLIYFEIPSLVLIEKDFGSGPVDKAITVLATEMARTLRPTDHIEVLNRHQFVVSICLLKDAQDLKSIAQRLSSVLKRQGFHVNNSTATIPAGMAVYPLDGYRGDELIESARLDYRRQIGRPDKLQPPVHTNCEPPGTGHPAARSLTAQDARHASAPLPLQLEPHRRKPRKPRQAQDVSPAE